MLDSTDLNINFKKKNYAYCANILREDIKQKLTSRVKIFKPEYKYTNLFDLKTNCYKYLNDKEKIYISILCRYAEEEYPITSELSSYLDIYKSYKI